MEVLLKTREIALTRADFETLCVGRHVSPKVSHYLLISCHYNELNIDFTLMLLVFQIMTMACERTRWMHTDKGPETVWCLPPSFVVCS